MTEEQRDIIALEASPGFQNILSFLQSREDDRLDVLESSKTPEELNENFNQWRAYKQVRKEMLYFIKHTLEDVEKQRELEEQDPRNTQTKFIGFFEDLANLE